jgi:DNA-binding FadR family transcriptional regulator
VDEWSDHENTVNTHAAIVDAIEARDEQAAATAMLEVIDIGYRRINDSSRKRSQKR